MKNKKTNKKIQLILIAVLLLSLLSVLSITQTTNGKKEIFYDDASAEEFAVLQEHGAAVLFDAPSYPWEVHGVKIYGRGVNEYAAKEISVEIWKKSDLSSVGKFSFPASKFSNVESFVYFELPESIVINESFYVVVFTYSDDKGGIGIGIDSDSRNKNSVIFKRDTPPKVDWSPATELGLIETPYYDVNFMIRVIGREYVQVNKSRVLVVANTVDYSLAGDFVRKLRDADLESLVFASAENYENYLNESNVLIILGGPDAYEGIGSIVQRYLSAGEQGFLRQQGNKAVYIKQENGKKIIIIAGADRWLTKAALQENEDKIFEEIQVT